MTRIVIVGATYKELSLTIHALDAKKDQSSSFKYVFSKGIILITGMGMMSTTMVLSQNLIPGDIIMNIGIAGSIGHHKLPVGSLHKISGVKHYLPPVDLIGKEACLFSKKMIPEISLCEEGVSLLSVDFPCYRDSVWQSYQDCRLVDMEGYACAYFAQKNNCHLHMFKIVSDFANSTTHDVIKGMIVQLSGDLASLVESWLKDYL